MCGPNTGNTGYHSEPSSQLCAFCTLKSDIQLIEVSCDMSEKQKFQNHSHLQVQGRLGLFQTGRLQYCQSSQRNLSKTLPQLSHLIEQYLCTCCPFPSRRDWNWRCVRDDRFIMSNEQSSQL